MKQEPKKKKKLLPERRGSALIFATIVLFVILTAMISLSVITITETKMSQKTKSSVGAFYNADSGVEWVLNKIATTAETNIQTAFGGASEFNLDGSVKCPAAFGSDICTVYFLDIDGKVIPLADISSGSKLVTDIKSVRSVGVKDNETQRAIEAAVAATGIGKYQISCTSAVGTVIYWSCFRVDTETGTVEMRAVSTNPGDTWHDAPIWGTIW